jgi:hypothetical protein
MFGAERKWKEIVSNSKCLQIKAKLAKNFLSFEFLIFNTMLKEQILYKN